MYLSPSPTDCKPSAGKSPIGQRPCPYKTDREYPESQCFKTIPSLWCSSRCAPCPYEIEKIPPVEKVPFGEWLYQERKFVEWKRLTERNRHLQILRKLRERNLGGFCESTLKLCPLALYAHRREGRLDSLRIIPRSPKEAETGAVTVNPGGLKISRNRNYQATEKPPASGGGIRGEVKGFSFASRRGCLSRLMAFDWQGLASASKRSVNARAFFVTLTYPAKFPTDSEKFKSHLDNLFLRLKRAAKKGTFPFQGAFWKVEPQRRGAPHYHVLLVLSGAVNRRLLAKWLALAWYQICETGDLRHKKAGVDVATVYGWKSGRLMNYLGKYLGKTFENLPFKFGRVWGEVALNKKDGQKIPRGQSTTYRIPAEKDWFQFVRRLRSWGRGIRFISTLNGYHRGAQILGNGPALSDLLRGLDFRWCDLTAGPDGSPF